MEGIWGGDIIILQNSAWAKNQIYDRTYYTPGEWRCVKWKQEEGQGVLAESRVGSGSRDLVGPRSQGETWTLYSGCGVVRRYS